MLLFIGGTMVIFEKLQRRAFISIVLTALFIAPGLWTFVLHDYQKNRVLTLLDSDGDKLRTGWHARQARIAVGSGGLLGKGHGGGTQVAGGFLPENHTDFVFAHLAEEHGFLGGMTVLLCTSCSSCSLSELLPERVIDLLQVLPSASARLSSGTC